MHFVQINVDFLFCFAVSLLSDMYKF